MIQKSDSLVDELYRVKRKAEIVDGRIVSMNAAGGWHGWVGLAIAASLKRHEEDVGGGVAFGDNVGFLVNLPRRKSFSPDAAWMRGSAADLTLKFIDGAPAFTVEVRSENDYGPAAEKRILRKINDYFAAGTQVVWDVDLLSDDVIKSFRSTSREAPVVFRATDQAEAEPAVPKWRFAVKKLVRS